MYDFTEIIQLLNQQGIVLTDTAMPASWHQSLLLQAQKTWQEKLFTPGEIGRDKDGLKPQIRGDHIYWIQPGSDESKHPFFDWMAQFRQVLNKDYGMSLQSQEFHFARYDGGVGYKKHIDQHRGTDHRKISIVYYLNQGWDDTNGGEICFYEPRNPDKEMLRAAPIGGRLAIFVSGVMPHEVLPSKAPRWSLTGWLRTDSN